MLAALVQASPPLDVNSTYAYMLICTHFSDTSVVAASGAEVVGFVSAYLVPSRPDTLFVWQVAVAAAARGRGLGRRMLRDLLARPDSRHVQFIETTITPSNGASWRLFRALAREYGAGSAVVDTIAGAELAGVGGTTHEDEQLLRIGPLTGGPQGGS